MSDDVRVKRGKSYQLAETVVRLALCPPSAPVVRVSVWAYEEAGVVVYQHQVQPVVAVSAEVRHVYIRKYSGVSPPHCGARTHREFLRQRFRHDHHYTNHAMLVVDEEMGLIDPEEPDNLAENEAGCWVQLHGDADADGELIEDALERLAPEALELLTRIQAEHAALPANDATRLNGEPK